MLIKGREYSVTQLLDEPEVQLLMRRDQVEREEVERLIQKVRLSRRWTDGSLSVRNASISPSHSY